MIGLTVCRKDSLKIHGILQSKIKKVSTVFIGLKSIKQRNLETLRTSCPSASQKLNHLPCSYSKPFCLHQFTDNKVGDAPLSKRQLANFPSTKVLDFINSLSRAMTMAQQDKDS